VVGRRSSKEMWEVKGGQRELKTLRAFLDNHSSYQFSLER
jgi:hypothetical protein